VIKSRLLAVLLAASALGLICVFFWQPAVYSQAMAPGHSPVRPSNAPSIALIDINFLFEKLPHFKQMMDQLKADVERAEAEVKREREELTKLVQRLESYRGTPTYKSMEEDIARRQSELGVRVSLQRKEFGQREARIFHNVYREIQDEVDRLAKEVGFDCVIRFNGDAVDPERPDSILNYINRPVVWYGRDRDITMTVLMRIAQRRGYEVTQDNQGNIVVRVATPRGPERPSVPFNIQR
jgi:Skp family chaperone for outer membrane proteins